MEKEFSMEDIDMDQLDKSMKSLRRGEIIKVTVASVENNELIVNTGKMYDGKIKREELLVDDNVELNDIFKEGQEIEAMVLNVNGKESEILLSKKAVDAIRVWDEIEDLFKKGETFEIKVKESVKGGVIADLMGHRAFIPASQLSVRFVKDTKEFVGQTLLVKIIEFNREKNKIVLSRREVEAKEIEDKRNKVFESLNKGDKRKGEVVKLAKFGAFVDLGGVEGLIHLSELSWKKVRKPEEVVSVGDQVEVYILDIDKENQKIALTLKEASENPWNGVETKYAKGTVHEGTVVKVLDFGAFVELEPTVQGLVHISQISDEPVQKVAEVLSILDKVKVKVLDVNEENKRISLSIKDAIEKPVEDFTPFVDSEEEMATLGDLFKDKLKNLNLK